MPGSVRHHLAEKSFDERISPVKINEGGEREEHKHRTGEIKTEPNEVLDCRRQEQDRDRKNGRNNKPLFEIFRIVGMGSWTHRMCTGFSPEMHRSGLITAVVVSSFRLVFLRNRIRAQVIHLRYASYWSGNIK